MQNYIIILEMDVPILRNYEPILPKYKKALDKIKKDSSNAHIVNTIARSIR